MELRIKAFDITGFHWEIWFLEGVSQKKQYIGEIAWKGRELGQFAD